MCVIGTKDKNGAYFHSDKRKKVDEQKIYIFKEEQEDNQLTNHQTKPGKRRRKNTDMSQNRVG